MAVETTTYEVSTTAAAPIDITGAKQVTLMAIGNPVLLGTEISSLVNTSTTEYFFLPADTLLKFDGGNRTLFALASGGDSNLCVLVVR